MHEVTRARAHEHLDPARWGDLEGGGDLVEGGSQAPARQVGADLDAIRSPVARAAHPDGIFDANLHDGHGCHLS